MSPKRVVTLFFDVASTRLARAVASGASGMASKAEKSAATRRTIIDVAREVVRNAPPSAVTCKALEAGVANTLEICARPDIQRIVFREAPTVAGPTQWREIEMKYAFGLMRQAVVQLAEQGDIDAPNADLTAQILLGAIVEAAHGVALAQDKAAALRQAKATVRKMLRALKSH